MADAVKEPTLKVTITGTDNIVAAMPKLGEIVRMIAPDDPMSTVVFTFDSPDSLAKFRADVPELADRAILASELPAM